MNYYASEVNESSENLPGGIILCADKNNVNAVFALGVFSNHFFVSV